MTPEERAKDICERLFRLGKYQMERVSLDPKAFIVAAIRQAENAALEKAESIAVARQERELMMGTAFEDRGDDASMEERAHGAAVAKIISEDIRSLKHAKG